MLSGKEFYQVGTKPEKALALGEDSQILLGQGPSVNFDGLSQGSLGYIPGEVGL